MARPLRIELAGGLYHVTSRGDRREDIYFSDADRQWWLNILGEACQHFNWRCHAWCQMSNHYHLVVETPEANLARGMRQLNGVYTQYTNRTHQRVGHVFKGVTRLFSSSAMPTRNSCVTPRIVRSSNCTIRRTPSFSGLPRYRIRRRVNSRQLAGFRPGAIQALEVVRAVDVRQG